MAGLAIDRTVSPARSRLSAPPPQWLVLVAVALGLLFGAMTCVAGLAGGVAQGASQPSVLEIDGGTMAHAGHLALLAETEAQSTPPGDHGGHSGSTHMASSHPGMACVVSVDLHFPEASSALLSDRHEIPLLAMSSGCPADVDPPVPRFS
jgi:zinc transporter ZupT